jgi:hypothetical protein
VAEIEFTIDPATGKLEAHVQGVAGPACDDVAKLLKELAGAPALEQKNGEYFLRPQVRPQVRPKGGPPR